MDWLTHAGRTERLDASRTDDGIPGWRSAFRVKRFGNPGRETGDLRFVIAWYSEAVAMRLLPWVLQWVVWHEAVYFPDRTMRPAGWGKCGVNWMTPKAEQAPNSAFQDPSMRWTLMAREDGRGVSHQKARGTAQERVAAIKGRGRAANELDRHLFPTEGVCDGYGPIRPSRPAMQRQDRQQQRGRRPGSSGQDRWNQRNVQAPSGYVVTGGVDAPTVAGPVGRNDYAYRPPAPGAAPEVVEPSPLAPGWNSNRGYMRAGPEPEQAQPKRQPAPQPRRGQPVYSLDHIPEGNPWAGWGGVPAAVQDPDPVLPSAGPEEPVASSSDQPARLRPEMVEALLLQKLHDREQARSDLRLGGPGAEGITALRFTGAGDPLPARAGPPDGPVLQPVVAPPLAPMPPSEQDPSTGNPQESESEQPSARRGPVWL